MSVPNFTKSCQRGLGAAIDSHGTRKKIIIIIKPSITIGSLRDGGILIKPSITIGSLRDGGILNIAASSNEVAKPSYDPENILNILRTGFGVPIPSLVRIHQRFAELQPNFLFDGLTAHFDLL